jgi:ribosomal protein S18 acetylase RimI-like enzyme
MKFVKLDINKHDLDKVSKLIYETELSLFTPLIGKNEDEAVNNLNNLIKAGNNSFGHENIHVAADDDENVLGILVAFSGRQTSLWNDFKAFSKVLSLKEFLKYIVKGTIINELLTANVRENDYYLSNVGVDTQFRGQGIGTYILENAFKIAEKKRCRRVILDVTFKNEGALRLYERFGFKVYGKTSGKWLWKDQGTYNMEHSIQ